METMLVHAYMHTHLCAQTLISQTPQGSPAGLPTCLLNLTKKRNLAIIPQLWTNRKGVLVTSGE